MKGDTSDPEPEGLTLLVPDIQRTAEIVRTATVSLKQASQGMQTCFDWANDLLAPVLCRVLAGKEIPIPASALTTTVLCSRTSGFTVTARLKSFLRCS